MSNATVFEQLDQAVNALIVNSESLASFESQGERDVASYISTHDLGDDIRELLEVAAELNCVARPAFKARLKRDLLDEAFVAGVSGDAACRVSTRQNGNGNGTSHQRTISPGEGVCLPSLFGLEAGNPAQRTNFAASVLLHTLAIGAFVASSAWMGQQGEIVRPRVTTVLADIGVYVPEPAREQEHRGGGSGGDRDRLSASQGHPPKFAAEQFTPPLIVVRNPQPELPAVPTVIGREQNLPQLSQLGDPLSRVAPPSNGTGVGGGIGSNAGTGVGGGNGPGLGPGSDGGHSGGIFRIGGGVAAPRPIYSPDPEYSDEARKAKYQGTVVLWAIVGADGFPRQLRVSQPLGMGLDQKAIEAVRHWRFEPAMKDGQPVAVQVNIEVNFRLY